MRKNIVDFMKKMLLILLSAVLLGAPVSAYAFAGHEGIEQPSSTISIEIKNKEIRVSGANGKKIEIYNLTGVSISTILIESNDATFPINLPKGCYILKVGKVVRKISIS